MECTYLYLSICKARVKGSVGAIVNGLVPVDLSSIILEKKELDWGILIRRVFGRLNNVKLVVSDA